MITTKQISDNIVAQLEASLGQNIPWLPKSFERVLAKTLAGVIVLVYQYANFMHLQQYVKSASNKETQVGGETVIPLKFWGDLFGVSPQKAATQAELMVTITVTNQSGSLSSGSQLIGSKNGVTYISIETVLLDADTVTLAVKAVSDQTGGSGYGVIGNLEAGDTLSFANPLSNVSRDAVVFAQSVTGAEGESTEYYRGRIEDRQKRRPQGGAYADYEQWAEETDGIIHAYPYTGSPGQVDIYSEATAVSSGSPDGIPSAAQLQAVKGNIEQDSNGLARRRNTNTFVNSLPISRVAISVSVYGISEVDNLAEVRAGINSAISLYLRGLEPFINGLHTPPRRDRITRTRLSAIVEDIVTAAGGTFSSLTFSVPGTAGILSAYSLLEGEKAKLSDAGVNYV